MIYKGLTLPQEITLPLSLRLCTAWGATAALAASKSKLMLLRLMPIVWHITHSLTLTLRHFQTELNQLEIISMWSVFTFIDDMGDISQAAEQKQVLLPISTSSVYACGDDEHFRLNHI